MSTWLYLFLMALSLLEPSCVSVCVEGGPAAAIVCQCVCEGGPAAAIVC